MAVYTDITWGPKEPGYASAADVSGGRGRGSDPATWPPEPCLVGQWHEPVLVAHRQVDAGQAGPLAVRLEQLRRLVRLDPTAAQVRHQLDQRQVADEPALVTPEPLQADDPGRPGPEPSLGHHPVGGRRRRELVEALEL